MLDWIRATIQLANSQGNPYRNPGLARFYVAFRNPVGAGQTPTWTVVAYDQASLVAAADGDETAGREVNPEAQSCPI